MPSRFAWLTGSGWLQQVARQHNMNKKITNKKRNTVFTWAQKNEMHWPHCLGKSTHQKAATSSWHQCRHHEGESARDTRRNPPHDFAASSKSTSPRYWSPACIQRWCHHSASPSQAKVHEATSPATNIQKTNQPLQLIAQEKHIKNVHTKNKIDTHSTVLGCQFKEPRHGNQQALVVLQWQFQHNQENDCLQPTNFQADSHTVPAQFRLALLLVQEILEAHCALPGKLAILWWEEGRFLKAQQRIDAWMDN